MAKILKLKSFGAVRNWKMVDCEVSKWHFFFAIERLGKFLYSDILDINMNLDTKNVLRG